MLAKSKDDFKTLLNSIQILSKKKYILPIMKKKAQFLEKKKP